MCPDRLLIVRLRFAVIGKYNLTCHRLISRRTGFAVKIEFKIGENIITGFIRCGQIHIGDQVLGFVPEIIVARRHRCRLNILPC